MSPVNIVPPVPHTHLPTALIRAGEPSGKEIFFRVSGGTALRCFQIKMNVGLHVRRLLFLSGSKQNTECVVVALTCGLTDGHDGH